MLHRQNQSHSPGEDELVSGTAKATLLQLRILNIQFWFLFKSHVWRTVFWTKKNQRDNTEKDGGILTLMSAYVLSCSVMSDSLQPYPSVHGIFLGRTLEWVAIFSSRAAYPSQGLNPHPLCLLLWQADSLSHLNI